VRKLAFHLHRCDCTMLCSASRHKPSVSTA
jgi:hypothetical protein